MEEGTESELESEPKTKKRKIAKMMNKLRLSDNDSDKENRQNSNDQEKEEAVSIIVDILENEESESGMTRDKLLNAVNLELTNKDKPKWRKSYQHKLGRFDDFIKENNRFFVSEPNKRNFLIRINEDFDAEQAKRSETDRVSASEDTGSNENGNESNLPSSKENIAVKFDSDCDHFLSFDDL